MTDLPHAITEARWPDDRGTVGALFREYVASLIEDISFQDVENELASLPPREVIRYSASGVRFP